MSTTTAQTRGTNTADDSITRLRTATQLPAHKRIEDVEILRGIAIIFVIIEHVQINLFPWLYARGPLYTYFGFWSGVDLFFAISGFVIARSLMPSLAAARDSVAFFNAALAFWVRRVWRLLPAAWLWLGLILIATIAFNRSGVFGSLSTNFEGTIAAVLDIANIRTVLVYHRFDTGATFPYWSLSLEEQFYLLLPFLILLSGRRLPIVLGVAVLLQLFLPRLLGTGWSLLLNQIRSDALLLGVLIAIFSRKLTYALFNPVFLDASRWAGFGLLCALVFLLAAVSSPVLHIAPFRVGLVALLSALLVLIASYDKNCFIPSGPLRRAMLWFGSRSYAIYLSHIPVFLATREIWYRLQPPGTVFTDRFAVRFAYTAAIILLVTAELSYRFVEVPLRRRGVVIAGHLAERTNAKKWEAQSSA